MKCLTKRLIHNNLDKNRNCFVKGYVKFVWYFINIYEQNQKTDQVEVHIFSYKLLSKKYSIFSRILHQYEQVHSNNIFFHKTL